MTQDIHKKDARFHMRTTEGYLDMLDQLRLNRQQGTDLPTRTDMIHVLIKEAHEKLNKKNKK